jgi:hypothetical protein
MTYRAAALVAVLASLALPASALAGWSASLTLSRTAAWPEVLATDSAGDVAVAWAMASGGPPSSENRTCALHPFRRNCYPIVSVHLAVRTAGDRERVRTVWRERSGSMSASVVIAHGEVTLGWGAYDVSDAAETAREVHGPLLGHWSRPRVLGRFDDVNFTGGRMPLYPQLAVAPDGQVLAAWSACGTPRSCPGPVSGVKLAWRTPGHGFGRSYEVRAAPEGAVPSFDAAGRAYLHSSCSGRVLVAAPGSHSFRRVVTLTHGSVRDLVLGLSGPGEGLASWIPTACSTDQAAESAPGPVLASVLRAGTFAAPRTLTAAGVGAESSVSVAVPGGGIVSARARAANGFPTVSTVSLGTAPALPAGDAPVAADGGGDIVFGSSFAQLPPATLAVLPAGGAPARMAPSQIGATAVAPFGRAVALAWQEGKGPLKLSVWRP